MQEWYDKAPDLVKEKLVELTKKDQVDMSNLVANAPDWLKERLKKAP